MMHNGVRRRKRGSYVFEVVVTDTSSDDTKTSVSFRRGKGDIWKKTHKKKSIYVENNTEKHSSPKL